MLRVGFPFSIDPQDEYRFLLENGFDNSFSLKQRMYYGLLRPIMPLSMRHLLQKGANTRVPLKTDFIYDALVKLVEDNVSHESQSFKYNGTSDCAVVLTHDVDTKEGFDFIPHVIELEQKLGYRSSWNIVPYKYEIDKGIINLIREAGHEIGIHGYNHDGRLYLSEKVFNTRVPLINDAIREYGAVGFRSPMVHRNLEWLQKLQIQYDASCFDYDPFQPFPGGTGSIWPFVAGKFVELPYTLPQDHTLYWVLGKRDIAIWKSKAEWVAKHKGVILTLTHPDYLIEPRLLEMYSELLHFLRSIDNCWFCLPNRLAEFISTALSRQ